MSWKRLLVHCLENRNKLRDTAQTLCGARAGRQVPRDTAQTLCGTLPKHCAGHVRYCILIMHFVNEPVFKNEY